MLYIEGTLGKEDWCGRWSLIKLLARNIIKTQPDFCHLKEFLWSDPQSSKDHLGTWFGVVNIFYIPSTKTQPKGIIAWDLHGKEKSWEKPRTQHSKGWVMTRKPRHRFACLGLLEAWATPSALSLRWCDYSVRLLLFALRCFLLKSWLHIF